MLLAAGLLQGYRATTDWCSLELLELFDVNPVLDQVVVDRNRITRSIVMDRIAFGLAVTAELFGAAIAQET